MAGSVAVSTASSASKKVAKAKKPSTHPHFIDMIVDAVKSLKERTGSSRHAILKYILVQYNLGDVNKANSYLKLALKKGVSSGALIQVKGVGASGSFKVPKEQKPSREIQKPKTDNQLTKAQLVKKTTIKQAKEAITKKPTAKRTAAVKSSKKATAKKPVAKKTVLKKATKKPASKKSSQKTTKKPVAKKPARK